MNWFHMLYGAHQIHFHMGAWIGTRSYILYDPKEKFGLVIWHNYGSIDVNLFPEAIRARFLDIAYDYPNKDFNWVDEIEKEKRNYRNKIKQEFDNEKWLPTPSSPYAHLKGVYVNKLYGKIRVFEQSSHLYMQYREHKVQLKHHNGSKFTFNPKDISPYLDRAFPYWVYFGYNKDKKMVLQNNLMFEGDDSMFVRE